MHLIKNVKYAEAKKIVAVINKISGQEASVWGSDGVSGDGTVTIAVQRHDTQQEFCAKLSDHLYN